MVDIGEDGLAHGKIDGKALHFFSGNAFDACAKQCQHCFLR